MMKMQLRILLLFGFTSLSLFRFAKSQTTKDSIDGAPLENVMIQENRFNTTLEKENKNIQVITRAQLDHLPIRSVNEALSYVAGVDFRQRGPAGVQGDVSIDGGTFDETLVLINGIRVTDPQTGHNMMNLPITMDVVDHIEIIRGAAARIYGVNALTGAINFVTITPKENHLSLSVNTGSNFKHSVETDHNYNSWGGAITGSWVKGKNSNLFSASHNNGNGYRYNTAYSNNKAFYQGRYFTHENDYLETMAGYSYNNFGANGFYAAPGDLNSGETIYNVLGEIGYHTKINSHWQSYPRVSYRFSQDDYRYIKNPLTARNLHKTHIFNAEWNNTIHTDAGDIGFGIEARNEHILSSNLGNHDRYNYGLSGEYKFADLGKLALTAGGYLNYNTAYGWQFFPGLDAGYSILPSLKLFTNIGTGQRLPTYTDLYYKGPSNIGNPDLTPEKADYAEGGLKYFLKNFNVTASYFYRRINDFIDWTKADINAAWQPNNFQRINTQGFTLAANYKWSNPKNITFKTIEIHSSYTNLQPKIDKPAADNNVISLYTISNLRNQVVGTISSEIVTGLQWSVSTRYLERISFKKYFLLDSKIQYSWKNKCQIFVDATNITNVTYVEAAAAPLPGRWYNTGIQFQL